MNRRCAFKGDTGTAYAYFKNFRSSNLGKKPFCVIWIRSVYAKGSNKKFELKAPIRNSSKFGLLELKIGLELGFASVK